MVHFNSSQSNMQKRFALRQMIFVFVTVAFIGAVSWYLWERFSPPKPFGKLVTLAGGGAQARLTAQKMLSDPFGIVADEAGNLFVTDGQSGCLFKVARDGATTLITDQLDMPSHLAFAPDQSLVVANTGAHTIVRVDPANGAVSLIAGSPNVSGNAIGQGGAAKFHAPIGVAVDAQGTIFVADTYNDQIKKIAVDGTVSIFAGSTQGWQDGTAKEAKFDTPCSIALWGKDQLIIADSGNRQIRMLDQSGNVTTQKFRQSPQDAAENGFEQPMAVLPVGNSELYLIDGQRHILYAKLDTQPAQRAPNATDVDAGVIYPLLTAKALGLLDGNLTEAALNQPTSLALTNKNTLAIADNGNGLIRTIVPLSATSGKIADPQSGMITAESMRQMVPPRWPYDPPTAPREIAGTLGEIRGEVAPDKDSWFHNGLDIPGPYGEPVRALYSERITRPLAVEGVGELRERLRLPLFGYIHVKIGRDQNDAPLGIQSALFTRDAQGKITGVRIPRGTHIRAGDIIGTLNRFNHVHLIAGNTANEVNAIAALTLPGLTDTKAPVIEGIRIIGEQGELTADNGQPISVSGKIKIIVRAYDQTDGVAAYRRLGVYRVGFQLLQENSAPIDSYQEPRFGIEFNRLPEDMMASRIAYIEPSQAGYTGKTIFDYVATNTVRDGIAKEEWLNLTALPKGKIIVRAIVEDFFRNRSTKEILLDVR